MLKPFSLSLPFLHRSVLSRSLSKSPSSKSPYSKSPLSKSSLLTKPLLKTPVLHTSALKHISRGLLATVSLTSALGFAADVAAETTVRAVMHAALRGLDPIASSATITRNHGYMIYDTLLGLDADYQPQPQMADWAVSEDGMTYTFTLREDLKWHDGSPVTAADCIASLKRWGTFDAGGKLLMDNTASLKVIDDKTFELMLANPFGEVLSLISKPSSVPAFMMPAHDANIPNGEPLPDQIGSGPFKFVADQFQPGVKVVYEKNDDYVPRTEAPVVSSGSKAVFVDRVEWINMPDVQTTINAINSGDIDYIERTPYDLLPLLEANPDVHAEVTDPLGWMSVARMNFLHPPFNDARIRRAALLAVSQQDVMAALIGDPRFYELCASVFGCQNPQTTEVGGESLTTGGDIEQAKQLLAEAGYDGTPVVILQPTDVATLAPQPIVLAQALRKVGFNVELRPMDWQTVVSQRASKAPASEGGWNMFITNYSVDALWSPVVNPLLISSGEKGSYFGWPTIPKMEKLRKDYATTTDANRRQQLLTEVQQMAMQEVNTIPLGQFKLVTSWRHNVTDVVKGPLTTFWGMKKDH